MACESDHQRALEMACQEIFMQINLTKMLKDFFKGKKWPPVKKKLF